MLKFFALVYHSWYFLPLCTVPLLVFQVLPICAITFRGFVLQDVVRSQYPYIHNIHQTHIIDYAVDYMYLIFIFRVNIQMLFLLYTYSTDFIHHRPTIKPKMATLGLCWMDMFIRSTVLLQCLVVYDMVCKICLLLYRIGLINFHCFCFKGYIIGMHHFCRIILVA